MRTPTATLAAPLSIAVVSDIHHAGPAEQARHGHELRVASNLALRMLVAAYRRFIWLRDPFAHNHLLDRFLGSARGADFVVANGDYSCDTAFVGVGDEAAFASASTALGRLRGAFPGRLAATFGDHELGKMSLVGEAGGPRVRSWDRCVGELGLEPFWRRSFGVYDLVGVVSSLVALPVFTPEILPAEAPAWERLRETHLAAIRSTFAGLAPDRRVILFCHDPTALPFLWQEPELQRRAAQIELTIIGHLHTPLVYWQSRLLAGMPAIGFLGNSVRRMSAALRDARLWRPFKVRLCPSLTGCQLLKDGGFGWLRLAPDGSQPAGFQIERIRW